MCVFACLCMCVCPPPRLLITSGIVWCDIRRPYSYDWLNKLYGLSYMAAVVDIISGRGVSIHTFCGN